MEKIKKFKLWIYFKGKTPLSSYIEVKKFGDKYIRNKTAITKAKRKLSSLGKKTSETFEAELFYGHHQPICWWEISKGVPLILHNFNKKD